MKHWMKRSLALALLMCLLLACLPIGTASAAGAAMDMDEARELLNGVTLHPQKTGYPEVDALLEEIFAPYADSDNFTKIKVAYDWTVKNINFSWAPYSQDWAPAYDCYDVWYELEYETGLQEAIPYETVNRSYHALKYHEGVCYDYASLFAVMARYIGFESYVHTGYFTFEPGFGNGAGHHGWTELCIDGVNYIFDPQRDYRLSYNGTVEIPYYYFGITYENAWRYQQDDAANAPRDESFLPVTAERAYTPVIEVSATESGTATGGGTYEVGESVTVSATGSADFFGWYTEDAKLLSTESTYTFPAERSLKLLAVFSGEFFADVSADAWYYADTTEACNRRIIDGIAPFTFGAEKQLTRAMAATMLKRAAQAEPTDTASDFSDVPADAWYAEAVAWAQQQGIIDGVGDGRFAPENLVTREQFLVMLMRYAEGCGVEAEPTELLYEDSDSVSAYALEWLQKAQTLGLLQGFEDNTLLPQGNLTRAQGVAFLMRLLRVLEAQ